MPDLLAALLPQLPTLEEIVQWGGYIGLCAIIFSETGLLMGFFLPGDSLLFTAGLFAARGLLDIVLLDILLCCAAILGNFSGYLIGRKAGQALYNRPQSRFFRRDHLLKTKEFYDRYGGITIFVACYMPFARTFSPVVAGIAGLKFSRFAMYNVVGAVCWICSMTLLGYFLGRSFPGIRDHIEIVIAVIIFVSVLPILVKYLQHRFGRAKAGGGGPGGAADADGPPNA